MKIYEVQGNVSVVSEGRMVLSPFDIIEKEVEETKVLRKNQFKKLTEAERHRSALLKKEIRESENELNDIKRKIIILKRCLEKEGLNVKQSQKKK